MFLAKSTPHKDIQPVKRMDGLAKMISAEEAFPRAGSQMKLTEDWTREQRHFVITRQTN